MAARHGQDTRRPRSGDTGGARTSGIASDKGEKTLQEQHLSFGFELNHVDDDITRLIQKLEHMKRLAEP
jgi:hypothetical protein